MHKRSDPYINKISKYFFMFSELLTRFNLFGSMNLQREEVNHLNNPSNAFLARLRAEKKVLIAAHRGTWGGNIIQNTIPAYENALRNGADMIEVDVVQSTDGEFFAFHTGQEPGLLRMDRKLSELTAAEIRSCRLRNCTQDEVLEPINRLDDILEHFKGRCLINIDRSWWYWEDTIRLLMRHHMEDQLILKSAPRPDLLDTLEQSGSNLMYMPIVRDPDQLPALEGRRLNQVGMEIIFKTEESPLISEEFLDSLHRKGQYAWVNALTLDDVTKLSAGHDDDTALLRDMDQGWGWLMERGFDVIQTDWPWLLREYREKFFQTKHMKG